MSTRPYFDVLFTDAAIDTLVRIDPAGAVDEAMFRRGSTLAKVQRSIVRQLAALVIDDEPESTPEPEPKPERTLKYGRTASGEAVSVVAGRLAHEAHVPGVNKLSDLYAEKLTLVQQFRSIY